MRYESNREWQPAFYANSCLFAPLLPLCTQLTSCQHWPSLNDYNTLGHDIKAKFGKSIQFVPQAAKSRNFEEQYEPRVYLKGEVQTRKENWHDFFNMLVWLTFPKTKAVLNKLHYHAAIKRHDASENRSVLEDALTLFDENGVIILSKNSKLVDLIKNFQWKELFWSRRQQVIEQMRFFVFGHALYEKALNPYIGMTGNGIIISVESSFLNQCLRDQLAYVDSVLAERFENGYQDLTSKHLQPLPILGIPGWSQDNEKEAYYDNKKYFRPARFSGSHALRGNQRTLTPVIRPQLRGACGCE